MHKKIKYGQHVSNICFLILKWNVFNCRVGTENKLICGFCCLSNLYVASFQVPVVAILGSGGGFRAMVGFSGVMKALYESGILDCATYIAGLSGSTWLVYIFNLFEFYFSKGLQFI